MPGALDGIKILELTRVAFWRLTTEFHQRSIAVDPQPWRTRPSRS